VRRVRVNRRAADRIASGHPWIFSSDVTDRADADPGEAVLVLDPKDKLLGTFHYSSSSQITLRQLSPKHETIDAAFLRNRIGRAIEFRKRVVSGSNACRLVYGEADGLPALIVDRYGDCLTIQTLDQGMDKLAPVIVDVLQELIAPRAIVARNDVSVRRLESLPLETRVCAGEVEGPAAIEMNGLKLQADLIGGQKTGIYLDQRENYLAAARHTVPGGTVLDCFSSTGGFALHLARTAESVEAVDSSESALATASHNAAANSISNIRFREADAFDLLASHTQSGRRFSTVILDPPAFAKTRSAVEGAAKGYRDINFRAIKLLNSGGILVTCSCSYHFSESMLLETVAAAALDAGRTLRVLERRTQASDHPVLLTVPETLYLKCLILEVV